MLDRFLYAGLAVVLVGFIAGQSYQYGRVQGELAALRAQQQAAVSQPLATPTPQPEQAIATAQTPPAVPRVEERAERVARSNAAALERLYALQAAAQARRAQEAAETVARLSQQLAAVSSLSQPIDGYASVRNDLVPRLTGRNRLYSSYHAPKRTVIEHIGMLHVNPCPPGEKLIAATCLPADSIILGQAPIPVQIVNPIFDAPIFEGPIVKRQRSQGRPSRNDVESGPMLPSLWQLQQPWYDGSSGPMLPSVWQLQQTAGSRR